MHFLRLWLCCANAGWDKFSELTRKKSPTCKRKITYFYGRIHRNSSKYIECSLCTTPVSPSLNSTYKNHDKNNKNKEKIFQGSVINLHLIRLDKFMFYILLVIIDKFKSCCKFAKVSSYCLNMEKTKFMESIKKYDTSESSDTDSFENSRKRIYRR